MNRKRQAIRIISLMGLIPLLLMILLAIIPSGIVQRNDPLVLATFALNGIVWTALLICEVNKNPFSFVVIHWCFFLMFFFFAAVVQYLNNNFPWVHYRNDEILTTTNLVLFFWTVGVVTGEYTNVTKKRYGKRLKKKLTCEIECKSFRVYVLIIFGICCWRISTVGFVNLLSRGTSSYSISNDSSSALLLDKCIQALAYYSTILAILDCKEKKRGIVSLICCIFMFISYPPTGIARYAAAAIYFGILLTYSERMKKDNLFVFLLIGSFSIALPMLNAFRNAAFSQVDFLRSLKNTISNFSTAWMAGDYDAYTILTLTIEFVSEHGSTLMRQFMGVLLFWVPRSVWANKPVGSGYHIATNLGWTFRNVSCPLPGEAFVNLGLIGILLFSFIIGKIMRYLDNCYWREEKDNLRRIDVLYPVIMMLFFFMCRGDLLSSTAYMTAYIVVGYLLTGLNCKKQSE